MKRSEEIRKAAAEEDNDLKALGLYGKAIREKRNEKFEDNWLPKIQRTLGDQFYYIESMYCWRYDFGSQKVWDFYPKANKVFIYETSEWVHKGLKWIVEKYEIK